jgi:hypothetical protein
VACPGGYPEHVCASQHKHRRWILLTFLRNWCTLGQLQIPYASQKVGNGGMWAVRYTCQEARGECNATINTHLIIWPRLQSSLFYHCLLWRIQLLGPKLIHTWNYKRKPNDFVTH